MRQLGAVGTQTPPNTSVASIDQDGGAIAILEDEASQRPRDTTANNSYTRHRVA